MRFKHVASFIVNANYREVLSRADESTALEEPHNAGKNRRILKEPCSCEFANYFRLLSNNQAFYGPSVARARVINAHTLTRSEL
jgi:hypothetical protein